jgi:MSHA biogenesis protein MshN
MSVINQVLLNLEKRRASPAERGVLPDHVRLLPDYAHVLPESGRRARQWGWVAAGVTFAVTVLTGWIAFTGTISGPRHSPVASGAAGVIESAASVSSGVSRAARSDESGHAFSPELGTFRLSRELSNPPAEPAPTRSAEAPQVAVGNSEPLSSARLIGRTGGESGADATRAGSAAPARSKAGAGAAAAVVGPTAEAAKQPEIYKQIRDPTPRELAEHQYRKAGALLTQGRLGEAEDGFRQALGFYPENHQARQGLVGLLVQGRKFEEAERVLEVGVKLSQAQTGFNVTLARLQAHRGDSARAIATLQNGLEHAQGSADYAAFLAALLQREGQHEEAIEHFQAALRMRPGSGVWWVGLGMSLQAANHPAAALDAYRQARATGNLHPDLLALTEQRLRQLQ